MAYNLDTTHDSPNYTPASQSAAVFGQARVIKGITIHWWGDPTQNPQFASIRDYLCRQGGNTSAHYIASGTNRQVACIISPLDVAWHSGNAEGNATTIGIECDPRCRDEDYDVVAELVADIRSAFGDVPIYSHNMWTSTSCPGNYDINRIDQLSYTKYSAPVAWGQGGDINPKAPVVVPPAPVVTPTPPIVVGPISNPSPTTKQPDGMPVPDTGKPITDKIDYSEANNGLLKQILKLLTDLITKFTNIFK